MDHREQTLRELFPDIDARLIKATVLDGDDMASAVEFLINEGIQTKPGRASYLISESAGYHDRIDGAFTTPEKKTEDPVMKGCTELNAYDEENLTNLSCDKHEESIVWKGGLKVNRFFDPLAAFPKQESPDNQDLDCQQWQPEETSLSETPQLIDWWAATWHGPFGSKEATYEFESTLSSAHTDSGTQGGNLVGSETEMSKSPHGPQMDMSTTSTNSSRSTTLEDASTSLQLIQISPMAFSTGCLSKAGESLFQGGLLRSQEASEVLALKCLENIILGGDESLPRLSHTSSQRTEDPFSNDEDNKGAPEHNVDERSVLYSSIGQEGMPESSRYNVDMEDLDRLVRDSKCCKEVMRKDMDSLTLLRQKVELEEMAVQHAKVEAASAGLEVFNKAEEMQQKISCKRADYEMRAAEVYGEKSVLSMEARELRARLLDTQAEQSKALAMVEDIRGTLIARLESAVQAKEMAMEEAEMKLKLANELLAAEQVAAQKLEDDVKVLEAEAERCKQLREFFVERGNIVDSLQGELAVVCEDLLSFKSEVDEGIPLSGSSALSWSRMSHLTDQSLHHATASSPPPMSTSSKCLLSECSLSSTSIVSLGSVMSEPPKSVRPIECTLHSQYFSPSNSVVEVAPCSQGLANVAYEERSACMQDVQEAEPSLFRTRDGGSVAMSSWAEEPAQQLLSQWDVRVGKDFVSN